MLAKIESSAIYGISAYRVDVEVDVSKGVPSFSIVGLPDTACRESIKRVLAALKNSGFKIPGLRITVNLAPAYLKKEGSMYDLAVAIGILTALEKIDSSLLDNIVICGELSLDGMLRSINGALPIADSLKCQKDKKLLIPFENLPEVTLIKDVEIVSVRNLNEAVRYLVEGYIPEYNQSCDKTRLCPGGECNVDFSDIKGSQNAKRAAEIAVAGGHNILLIGPPGAGKTMIAKRIPTIMDELTDTEAIESSKVYSVAGLFNKVGGLIRRPPFRSLHHTISDAGMIGGGSNANIRPGEISLAHNGVLFLDELPEFRKNVLEALRLPLEEGIIRISRCNNSVTYPARFMLVAAMNPCPCGFLTHPEKNCNCSSPQIQKYLSKISGPLLDRIDMHVEAQPIKYEQMRQHCGSEASKEIRSRIKKAHTIQKKRYSKHRFRFNSGLPHKLVNEACAITDEAANFLHKAMSELFISARGYDKILKVARTIADLDAKEIIGIDEIAEAISYRSLDTKLWL